MAVDDLIARAEAARFLYKHGELTHSAAKAAVDKLCDNGFAIVSAAQIAAQAAEIERLRAERPGLWCAGRDAAADDAESKCPKCDGEGWLWGYELDDPPDTGSHDDTRYSCDGRTHRDASRIRALTPPETEGRG